MRIKNMGRFIIALTIIFTLAGFITSMITTKVFSHEEPKYEKTIVCRGDTLWSIAKQYDGNINENIYKIKELNNLTTSEIYIGQELLLPALL